MMWRVTLQSFAVLGRKWRDLAQEYNKVITGQDREEPRWEQCMASLTGSLGIALSSLYVKNHFKGRHTMTPNPDLNDSLLIGGSKETAMEMVDYIHKEFLQLLNEVDWMDDNTRQRGIEKGS